MLRGIAKSTATDYARKQATFAGFCINVGQNSVPCNIDTMIKFVTWLHSVKMLAASSIKGFVAAVRHLHLINGEIWSANQDPRFQLIMAGISKRTSPKDNRDPLLPADMEGIKSTLAMAEYDNILFWSALTLAFGGFLRVGEVSYNPLHGGCFSIASSGVDLRGTEMTIELRNSKNDREHEGCKIVFKAGGNILCPVSAMEKFLNIRPPTTGDSPLFVHIRGMPMTGAWFRNKLSECCKEAGIKKIIKGHSIRIGAASEAVNQGIPFHIIQSMGRWKSDCAKRYIRLTGSSMANFRMALTNI